METNMTTESHQSKMDILRTQPKTHQSQIAEYLADNYLHGDTELALAFAKRILDAELRQDYPDMLATIEAARVYK